LDAEPERVCTPKFPPTHLVEMAARIAVRLNPANAVLPAPYRLAAGMGMVPWLEPQHIALLTSAYWGPKGVHLTVGFMERTPSDLANRILSHANAWGKTANVQFSLTNTDPMVRITRSGEGYYSYLGTGILSRQKDEETMCLQDFTMQTPDSEFYRVVRHEVGHTLGFPHEHMRSEIVALLDPQKTIRYFGGPPNFWPSQMVQEQILTPLDPNSIRATQSDQQSIMCYQIGGQCTKSGQPILGGTDIDELDYQFAASIYPKSDVPGGSKPLSPDEIYKKISAAF
jgi:hypothetical protein